MKEYDVIIIGGGIIGTTALQNLSEYGLSLALLEKGTDVASGASKANSGIVHAGYDCEPNTLKARFNVEGNKMYRQLCAKFFVSYGNCGSLVVAEENGLDALRSLKEKGDKSGVDTEIISRERILEIEPNVADSIQYALYAKTAGIVSPYGFCIAVANNAVQNGAEIFLENKVEAIEFREGYFYIKTNKESFKAKYVVNSAGAGGMEINAMLGAETYDQQLRRGEYLLLDSNEIMNVSTIIFPLPTEKGKGILVAPTVGGNVIYGPTSSIIEKFDTATTFEGLDEIKKSVGNSYKNPNFKNVIRVYTGVRTIVCDDFIVEFSKKFPQLFMTLGICSPGLTAGPAIAKYIKEEIVKKGGFVKKQNIVAPIKPLRFTHLSDNELNELIKKDKAWGKMVCRCEKVCEAEIVQAIHSPLKATTTDAIKRRTRAGMGRCQGGFCQIRVMEILARELGVDISEIKKETATIAVCGIKEGEYGQF